MNEETKTTPRFSRRNWLKAVFILLLLLYTVVELSYRFMLPTDGWMVTENELPGLTYVQNILGEGSPMQEGDRVIAVEGNPVDYEVFSTSTAIRETWQIGAVLDYSVVRAGQEIIVPVKLVHWQLLPWVLNRLLDPTLLIGLLSSLALFAVAAAIFIRRPDNPAAFPFLIIIGFFALTSWSETLPFGFPVWTDPLAFFFQDKVSIFLLAVLFPYALIRFALVFPRPKPIQRRYPWLSTVWLVFSVLLLITTFGTFIAWYWFLFSMFLSLAILVHNGITMRDPVSRAQVRWGVCGILIGIGAIAIAMTANTFGLVQLSDRAFDVIGAFSITVIGVMISVAITRYRLFDIDVIIRRTLQYTILTGLLVLVYFGSVVLLQGLVENVAREQSPVVIVISTLLIAALFNPLRIRIQDFIDRRFYRRKYDAEQALAQFANATRDEMEMDNLTAALLAVVDQTMQPQKVSFWLRERDTARRD
jgi:hypothetical protein